MSQVQAQTKDLALLWRFAQPPLRYRQPKRILAIRERTPPSVWFGDRVQLPAEVSCGERITPGGFAGKPQMNDAPLCLFVLIETRSAPALTRCYPHSFTFYLGNPFPRFVVKEVAPSVERGDTSRFPQCSPFHNFQNLSPAGR